MNHSAYITALLLALLICVTSESADRTEHPSLIVDPLLIEHQLFTGESTERYFNISNTGEDTIDWQTQIEIISMPDRDVEMDDFLNRFNESGVQRDEAGEILARYDVPYSYTCGLAWDGELMWGVSRSEDRCYAINPETGEVEHDFPLENRPFGMTMVNDRLWIGASDGIMIYDPDGEMIDQFVPPFVFIHDDDLYGIAFDHDSLVYINSWEERRVFVVNIDDPEEEVASFDIIDVLNLDGYTVSHLEWVPHHRDGHLWAIIGRWQEGFFAYRLSVDEDWDIEVISRFEFAQPGHVGIAHDGVNLWHGGHYQRQTWDVYDDGDSECYWMSVFPRRGRLVPNEDIDVFITLDATRLLAGCFETGIHVLSNDPDNSDIEVIVSLEITDRDDITPEGENPILTDCVLLSAFPNPFNSTTTIRYSLPFPTHVSLAVYNPLGQRITTLFEGYRQSGAQTVNLSRFDLPSGLYFIRLEAGGNTCVRSILLVR